jgi:hypothetical protein
MDLDLLRYGFFERWGINEVGGSVYRSCSALALEVLLGGSQG